MCPTAEDGRYYGGKTVMQFPLHLNRRDRFLLLQRLVLALTHKSDLNVTLLTKQYGFFFSTKLNKIQGGIFILPDK